MYSLRTGLRDTNSPSVRAMQSSLAPSRSSVRELLQIHLIHQHYLSQGGRFGPLGYPVAEVRASGPTATREYRGGFINVLHDATTAGFWSRQVAIRFLGFRCVKESDHDQGTPTDEPYFVITIDRGDGRPITNTFGPFENIETGTQVGVGTLLIEKISPNPVSVRVSAYENDQGDPKATAEALQTKLVEISNEVASIASASPADAADGPGIGVGATAAGAAGVLAGPLGALAATLIVDSLDLGDDFIGESVRVLFARPEQTGTPKAQGDFTGNPFNLKIDINNSTEGQYELFFDVHVTFLPDPITVPEDG